MCLCVCVCLDINNVVHVPATFIATSHGGRSGRCNRHPTPLHLIPSQPRPAATSTTAPGVLHSSVLAVFASIAANDILLAKVQNLPVHSCRSSIYAHCAHCPTVPQSQLSTRTMRLAAIIEAGRLCFCLCLCCKWLCLLWAFASGLLPP